MKKKATIPKAIREQCWLVTFGKKYESQCYISWCKNNINVLPLMTILTVARLKNEIEVLI